METKEKARKIKSIDVYRDRLIESIKKEDFADCKAFFFIDYLSSYTWTVFSPLLPLAYEFFPTVTFRLILG